MELDFNQNVKELGLNEVNKEENNNLNEGSDKIAEDNEDSKKINTKTDKKIVDNLMVNFIH